MANNFGIKEDGLYLVQEGIGNILIRRCNVIIPSDKSPIKVITLTGLADSEVIYDVKENVIYVNPNNKEFVKW